MLTHQPHRRDCRVLMRCLVALMLFAPGPVRAQMAPPLPTPQLFVLTPPGGKVGSSLEVTFAGQDLEEPQALIFSHPGIRAEPIKPPPPPPVDPNKKPPAPPPPPAPITRFRVTISAGVPPGIYDARFVGRWGMSNPRAFVVGDLAEVAEKEPNNDVPEAQRIPLGCTVNGSLASPVDVDYYVFASKKGQRVVLSCLASSIDSRAHPAIEVYDVNGRLLTENRHYHHQDALTDVIVPADGDYYIRVFEFSHTQGSAEHFYRLSVSTAPWIDAVHPCVLEPGKATTVSVWGRNLPGGTLDPQARDGEHVLERMLATVNAPSDPERLTLTGHASPAAGTLDGFELRLHNEAGSSNPFLLAFARAPVLLDNGVHDTPQTAQEVTPPCEIAGRIEKRRDRDWYAFTARKGETYNLELFSERLGSPALMSFFLKSAAGKEEPRESEDNPDFIHQKFFARTDDPAVMRLQAPAEGRYQLLVINRLGEDGFGPRHFYRLRLTPDQPDFRLVALAPAHNLPEVATLRAGGSEAFTVFVLRRDGFAGEVTLNIDGLPSGVTARPVVVGTGLREAEFVVTAAPSAKAWAGEVRITGTATIGGHPVVRQARAASIVWPAPPMPPIPTAGRMDRGLFLAVRDQAPFSATAQLERTHVVQGTSGTLKVAIARLWKDFKGPLTLQPVVSELPGGLVVNNNQPLNVTPAQTEVSLPVAVNPAVPVGNYTIVLQAQAQVPFSKDPKAVSKPPAQVQQPTTPVMLTVVPRELAQLALSNPAPTLKVGAQLPLQVRVQRLNGYGGEFNVQVVLPPQTEGIDTLATAVPAGKNEALLLLSAAAGAAPGVRANLTLRVTAGAGDAIVIHELKFNVNVVK